MEIEQVWNGSKCGWMAVGSKTPHFGDDAKYDAIADALKLSRVRSLADSYITRAERMSDQIERSLASARDEEMWAAYAGTVRKGLPKEDYAGDDAKSFPIENQADVEHAAMLLHHAPDPEAVKRRMLEIIRRKKLKPPASWGKKKRAA